MGRIVAPYAVKGWVKLQTFTEYLDSLLDYRVWRVGKDGNWRDYRLLDGKVHGQTLLASLEGVNDRNASEALQGMDVAVLREEMPEADEDEYYWDELIGLDVLNIQGEALGRVVGLLETGANDVLQVQGERLRLIPFVEAYIQSVDVATGKIVVDWGLDWDMAD
jgi:16S rRNA processing protein RimM